MGKIRRQLMMIEEMELAIMAAVLGTQIVS